MSEIESKEDLQDAQASGSEAINLNDAWGVNILAVVCENCDWSYILPEGGVPEFCPHCFRAALTRLDETITANINVTPPELYLPFTVSKNVVAGKIEHFTHGIRFPSKDLTSQNLCARLNRVYLPKWLVDIEVSAMWEAETGFDYDVVSHREKYNEIRGGWITQEVTETRIRWESRVGRLSREYPNITAPASEEDIELERKIGGFDYGAAKPYLSEVLKDMLVRLPNRSKEDAWPSAVPTIQVTAAQECRQAASSDHIRQFRWNPEYRNKNWTLLLMPMYTTYYLDDENKPQSVFINGQSGQLGGSRRASMKRAQKTALIVLFVAVAIFVISLLISATALIVPPVLLVGAVGIVLSIITGILAAVPIGMVWQFNRKER